MVLYAMNEKQYDTTAIRELLSSAFNHDEFTIFCFDHFPAVHKQFSSVKGFLLKIQYLLDFCQQHGQWEKLVELVAQINPYQYEQHQPYVKSEPSRVKEVGQSTETAEGSQEEKPIKAKAEFYVKTSLDNFDTWLRQSLGEHGYQVQSLSYSNLRRYFAKQGEDEVAVIQTMPLDERLKVTLICDIVDRQTVPHSDEGTVIEYTNSPFAEFLARLLYDDWGITIDFALRQFTAFVLGDRANEAVPPVFVGPLSHGEIVVEGDKKQELIFKGGIEDAVATLMDLINIRSARHLADSTLTSLMALPADIPNQSVDILSGRTSGRVLLNIDTSVPLTGAEKQEFEIPPTATNAQSFKTVGKLELFRLNEKLTRVTNYMPSRYERLWHYLETVLGEMGLIRETDIKPARDEQGLLYSSEQQWGYWTKALLESGTGLFMNWLRERLKILLDGYKARGDKAKFAEARIQFDFFRTDRIESTIERSFAGLRFSISPATEKYTEVTVTCCDLTPTELYEVRIKQGLVNPEDYFWLVSEIKHHPGLVRIEQRPENTNEGEQGEQTRKATEKMPLNRDVQAKLELTSKYLKDLASIVYEHYSKDELRYELCPELDFEYEDLPTHGRKAQAGELVNIYYRRNNLDTLKDAIAKTRPNVSLPILS